LRFEWETTDLPLIANDAMNGAQHLRFTAI
jgi:hypothetical protein